MGTLGTVPLVYALAGAGVPAKVLAACVVAAVGVWISGLYQERAGGKDPSEVVIDEAAGFLVTMAWVPVTAATVSAGFILFRLFDIFKPYPIRRIERLPGGWGVVADDLMAGLYALVCLRVLVAVLA